MILWNGQYARVNRVNLRSFQKEEGLVADTLIRNHLENPPFSDHSFQSKSFT